MIGSNEHLVSFYYNAATDAREKGAFKAEIANLKQAIEANKKTRNWDVYTPRLYSNLISYAYHDSIPLVLVLLDELESASEKYTTGTNRKYYVNALKHLAFAQEDFIAAVRYGKEYLTSKSGSTNYEEIVLAENFLANSYEKNGNREAAYLHFKNATILKDSITNAQKVKALSYYQTLYETEKRDLKFKTQESDIALLDARNKVKINGCYLVDWVCYFFCISV